MTDDPFEQARETTQHLDHEPHWSTLRHRTLERVALGRAQDRTRHPARGTPRWTTLLAGLAVAGMVLGVLGMSQLLVSQAPPDRSPTPANSLHELLAEQVLRHVREAVLGGTEPLAASISVVAGDGGTGTVTIDPTSGALAMNTGRYSYEQHKQDAGGLLQQTLVDHERRVWWSTIGTEPLTHLPKELAVLAAADMLGPLVDPRGLKVEVVGKKDRTHKQLKLVLTSDPASATMHGLRPTGAMRTSYVIDRARWLPMQVSTSQKSANTLVRVVGDIRWKPDDRQVAGLEVPPGYRQLNPDPPVSNW